MSLDNIAAEHLASTVTAVVGTLGGGETVPGPAIGPAVGVKEGVLLLKTEPELFGLVGLHQDGGIVAEVEGVGLSVGHPSLGDDEDVVAAAPGIGVVGDGAEVDIGVVARGLVGRRAVKVPFGQVCKRFDLLGKGLQVSELANAQAEISRKMRHSQRARQMARSGQTALTRYEVKGGSRKAPKPASRIASHSRVPLCKRARIRGGEMTRVSTVALRCMRMLQIVVGTDG